MLLSAGFQPARSIVMAFGFDEEISGAYGAQELANFMLSKYGENAFSMLIDEGGGFGEQYGGIFAVPAVGEKGRVNVMVNVSSPGGHSSIPPAHTSIGMLAALLVHYEANPPTPQLDRSSPLYGTLQCLAKHAPGLPKSLRSSIIKSAESDKALLAVEEEIFKDNVMRSLVGTTQALDLIGGGVKINALPEQAWAVINHRIATQSSVSDVKSRATNLLLGLANQFNLSYNAFGEEVRTGEAKHGSLFLTDAWGAALEPAPITPTDEDAVPYKLLSGTIKATYNAHRSFQNEEEIQVAPGIMGGNTDTRFYWKLTEHIFRYKHYNSRNRQGSGGVHTVNESVDVDAFIEMILFFTTLILNADESSML